MKKASKNSTIITTLLLLLLAFLCVFNVTHSYFSATAKIDGTLNFPDMNVCFIYYFDGDDEIQRKATNTLYLAPTQSAITRNEPFKFKISPEADANPNAPLGELGIQNREESCYCYVRFWIDAFIVGGDGTNYGKYFLLNVDETYVSNKNSSSSTSWCYYSTSPLEPFDGGALMLGDQLTLSDLNVGTLQEDLVPVEILGSELVITISFEAVQYENNAYTEVFNDEKGYYEGWDI